MGAASAECGKGRERLAEVWKSVPVRTEPQSLRASLGRERLSDRPCLFCEWEPAPAGLAVGAPTLPCSQP